MVPDIFHRDFTPIPYWWEAYTPTAGDLADVPRAARAAIVGGGYAGLSAALELAKPGAYMVPRERQREEIASDYYFGGMVVERSGKLHPALYYKGLLEACRRRGVPVCANSPVTGIRRKGVEWYVETARGAVSAGDVVIATNGYTGSLTPALRRRVV